MKQKKRILLGILSFLIPFAILTVIFSIKHLFTDKTIIGGDAYSQYYPLYSYLKGIFEGTNSIFYTFYKNFGGTMFGTFFYYLSSPLNIFVKIINIKNIPIFMTWLIIIKMSLCSLTMYIYMTHENKKSNPLILAFSICYGLMGYNINFFVNCMWLDVVLLTPLVLLGLDKIINKESPLLYIIMLFLSILSNYYIAYMLCVFCVIYFTYKINIKYDNKRIKKEILKKFIVISLLTGLMCSFFLIPCIAESKNYLRSVDLKEIMKLDYNIFDIFSKTYLGSTNIVDILDYSSMNIYCGSITIPLVYLYLSNKNISKKERKLTLFVLLILILPVFIKPLDYIWHLFSIPYSYSYRYSFLICFFIINIAYKSYLNLNIDKLKILKYLSFYSIISFYFVILTEFGEYYDFLDYKMIWITILFILIYMYILKTNKFKKFLFLIIIIENIINLSIVFNILKPHPADIYNYNEYKKIVEKYNDGRIDIERVITNNDSLLMQYHGINHFLSTNNNRLMRFITKTIFKKDYTKENLYIYEEGQYIIDSIIGLKYIITQKELDNYILREKIEDKSIYIYENPNYIGLGYIIKDECNDIDYGYKVDQQIYNCISGMNTNYYKEYKIEKNDTEYKATIKMPNNLYIYYPDLMNQEIEFDDTLMYYHQNMVQLENNKKDYIFKLKIKNDIEIENLKFYSLDYKKLKETTDKLKKEVLDYEIKGNILKGNINTNGGILMITIPYEKGYIIKVDGKKANYKEVLNTFIGIDLEKGYHEIEISYKQPYLKEGIMISAISMLMCGLMCYKYQKEENKKRFTKNNKYDKMDLR